MSFIVYLLFGFGLYTHCWEFEGLKTASTGEKFLLLIVCLFGWPMILSYTILEIERKLK